MKQKIVLLLCLLTLFTYQPAHAENWLYTGTTGSQYLSYDADYTAINGPKLRVAIRYEIITPQSDMKYFEEFYKINLKTLTGVTFMSNSYDRNHNLIGSDRNDKDMEFDRDSPLGDAFAKAIERYEQYGR